MSLATYSDLQSQITNWMGGRTDLTTFYPDWITLFEAYAARRLRVRPMEINVTLTPSGGAASLPADYLGWKRVTWTGNPVRDLTYEHPSYILNRFATLPDGPPEVFTIEGPDILLMPVSDVDIDFVYYAKNSALSSALNWLFTKYPDAYLWGSLLEGAIFTSDTDAATIYKARRDEVFDEISKANFREQGANMASRTMDATP